MYRLRTNVQFFFLLRINKCFYKGVGIVWFSASIVRHILGHFGDGGGDCGMRPDPQRSPTVCAVVSRGVG